MLTNFDSKQYRPRYFLVKLVNIKKNMIKNTLECQLEKSKWKLDYRKTFVGDSFYDRRKWCYILKIV